jgi:hypothetical protein
VKFAVVNGKPRLRIFANQQLNEVDKETDYIDPNHTSVRTQTSLVCIIPKRAARWRSLALWSSR